MNRYIMLGRGICEKYQSREEKFTKPLFQRFFYWILELFRQWYFCRHKIFKAYNNSLQYLIYSLPVLFSEYIAIHWSLSYDRVEALHSTQRVLPYCTKPPHQYITNTCLFSSKLHQLICILLTIKMDCKRKYSGSVWIDTWVFRHPVTSNNNLWSQSISVN